MDEEVFVKVFPTWNRLINSIGKKSRFFTLNYTIERVGKAILRSHPNSNTYDTRVFVNEQYIQRQVSNGGDFFGVKNKKVNVEGGTFTLVDILYVPKKMLERE